MSDIQIIAAYVRDNLSDIGDKQKKLGEALQGAAPAEKTEKPNNSVRYLLEGGDSLLKFAEECAELYRTTSKY